jgi:autotransporter-associated beta strand protein
MVHPVFEQKLYARLIVATKTNMKSPDSIRVLTALAALSLSLTQAGAAVRTWSGAGADANWTTAANWGGTAPATNDSLVFNGVIQQSNTNNYVNLTNNWVTFNNGGFVLYGNLLTLNGGAGQLTNLAGINVVGQPLQIAAANNNSVWNIAAGSELRMANLLTNASSANPLASLIGGGTLHWVSNTVSSTRMVTTYNGTLIDDGASAVIANDGFRLSPTNAAATAAVVMTNNGFIQIGGNSSLRMGQLQNSLAAGNASVNISSGEILLQPAGDNGAPSYGGCITLGENPNVTATITQSGGLVWLNPLVSVPTDANCGNLIYGANSTGNGTYNLNGGVLLLRSFVNAHPGGMAVFNFNGGTLKPVTNSTVFMPNSFTANVQAGGAVIDTTALSITMAQNLAAGSPSGGLVKLGTGTLTLTGDNTYTGSTVVSNGTLVTTSSSFLGGGAITLASNAILSVTYSGSPLAASALNLGSSVTNIVAINLGASPAPGGSPVFVVTNLNGTGTALLNISGSSFIPGTYPLIAYTNVTGAGSIKLGSVPLGVSATLVQSGNAFNLVVAYVPKNLEWSGTASPNWDLSSINWYDLNNGNNPTNYAQAGGGGDAVTFDDNGGANPNVNIGITVTPSQVTFDNNGVVYTLSGNGAINGGTSLIMDGFQSVTLGTVNNYSGGTTLNAGTVYVAANQALGTGPVTLNLGELASAGTAAETISNTVIQNAATGVVLGDTVNTGTLTLAGGYSLGGLVATLDFNSDVIVSGSLTNGGIGTKTGSGNLIITGQGAVNAQATQAGGNTLINGGTLVQAGDGWRMEDTAPGTTMDFAITNGGSFIMTNLVTGNLRLGLAGEDISTSYVLDVAGRTVVYAAGNPATAGRIYLGMAAQKATVNLWPGGTLVCGQVTSGGTSDSEVDFYGGTLTPTFSTTTFFQGLTNALVQDGGVTVDTTNLNVTIAQPLLAAGSGGLTKAGSGTLTLTGANTYAGPTIVNAGKLVLGPAHASPGSITVNANSILAFLQSSPATVDVPGVTIGGGTNSALEDDFSVTNTPGGIVTNLVLDGLVAVNVNGPLSVGEFPLFGYGTISGPGGLTLGQLPLGTVAMLVTNTAAHTIDLVVSGIAQATWVGNVNGNWDTTTTNWLMSGMPVEFATAANVLFNDTASNAAVNLTTALSPSSVLVSNSVLNYSFSGSGSLAGSMTLTKKGTGGLAVNTADTFIGNVTIGGGTLQLVNATALGSAANNIYITNGGTLDIDGNGLALQPIVVSGVGANGAGALLNSGADQNNAFRSVTLTGDTTVGGTGLIGLRTTADTDPGLVSNGHNLTKVGTDQFNLNGGTTVAGLTNVWITDLGNVDVKQGVLSFERRCALGLTNNTLTVEPGATLQMYSLNQTLPVPVNQIVLTNATLQGTGATAGDINTLGGPITLNGPTNAIMTTASTVLNLNGPIVGTGGVTFGTVTLAGANTYTGPTTIAAGTLTLTTGALLTGSPGITIATNGTLDVSAISPWTLGANQTLGGAGTISGNVVANGTVAPGNGTGTLTFNGNLTLNGNVLIEINKSLVQSNDMAYVGGSLNNTGSGTLTVTNLGPALAVGDQFTLFSQPVTGGGMMSVVGGGVNWTNNLAVDGSISVLSIISTGPTHSEPITFTSASGNLNLQWPTIGWRLQVQTNSLASGLYTNWVDWPGATTTNSVNVPVNPANPATFFRLIYP